MKSLYRHIAMLLAFIMFAALPCGALAEDTPSGLPPLEGEAVQPTKVYDEAGLLAALDAGCTDIELCADILLTGPLTIPEQTAVTVGGATDGSGAWQSAVLTVPEGISLTVSGRLLVRGTLILLGTLSGNPAETVDTGTILYGAVDEPADPEGPEVTEEPVDPIEPAEPEKPTEPEEPTVPEEPAPEDTTVSGSVELLREGAFPAEDAYIYNAELSALLKAGLTAFEATIDVSACAVTPAQFASEYQRLLNTDYTLAHVGGAYSLTVAGDSVTRVEPSYDLTAMEAFSMQKRTEASIREIIADCIRPGMTEAQKALAVNDWFCCHFKYSLEDRGGAHDSNFILTRYRGVCQAYADAYCRVMQALGITCYTVTSYAMRHAWNMVMIDGKLYQVDTTWNDRYNSNDDPALGFARHEFFLCSDSAMFNKPESHYGIGNAPAACTSTLYDNYFWQDIDSPISITDSAYYYPLHKGNGVWAIVYRPYNDISTPVTVKEVDCRKPGSNDYTCMGMAVRGGRIYYNDALNVYSCLMDGTGEQVEATPHLYYGYNVSRMYISGDTLYYGVSRDGYVSDYTGTLQLFARQLITAISLPDDFTVSAGTSGRMTASITPDNSSNKALTWTSSDPDILSVDQVTGAYRALHSGRATLTAAATDGSGITAVCEVTVTSPLRTVAISGAVRAALTEGGEIQLTATGTDASGGTRDITADAVWSSSNNAIATVTAGLVTPAAKGSVTIRCTIEGKTATRSITVVSPVTDITISGPDTVTGGRTARLTATAAPGDASNKAIVWTSSDTDIATVSGGTVSAKRIDHAAEVTITATAADGFGASMEKRIRVTPATASVSILRDGADVTASRQTLSVNSDNSSMLLTAQALPADAAQSFIWTSSSPATASVTTNADGSAAVTGLKSGTAVITAASADGSGKKATLTVTVTTLASGISITNRVLAVTRDKGTLQMQAAFTPAGVTNKSVLWSVENGTGRASIDSRGRLAAMRNGSVTVTVTALDGSNKSASVQVELTNQTSYALLYGPKLSASTVTLNRRMTNGAALSILPLGDGEITSVSLSDSRFAITRIGDTDDYRITAATDAPASGRCAMTLSVFGDELYEYAFTVNVSNVAPTVTLKAPRINLFYTDTSYPLTASSRQGECTVTSILDDPNSPGFTDSFEYENGMLSLKPGVTAPVTKGRAAVLVEGFPEQILPVTVTTFRTAARLIPSVSRFAVARDSDEHSIYFTVYDSADRTRAPAAVTAAMLASDRTGAPQNADKVEVSVDAQGRIKVTLLESYLSLVTRTVSIPVKLAVSVDGWAGPVQVSVTISVQTALPTVRFSTTSVRLNKNLLGEVSTVDMLPSQSNVAVTGALIQPAANNADGAVSLTFEDGALKAALTAVPTGRSYRFTVTPQLVGGMSARPATVSVSIISAVPALTLSPAGGSINVYNRTATACTYRLKLTNTVDSIASVNVDAASQNIFECAYDNGTVTLRMKEDAAYSKGQRFNVTFTAQLFQSGKSVSRTMSVSPSSALPRMVTSTVTPVFYGGVNAARNTRRIPFAPAFGEIESVSLLRNARTPEGFTAYYDAASGCITVVLDGTRPVKAGRYTLTLNVILKGQPAGGTQTYSTQVRLNVTVSGSMN